MKNLKPLTRDSWKQLEFNQNYIPMFYILNAHISRGISLYAKVTGGSSTSERNGNCYLQLPAGLKLSSDLICSTKRIAAGYDHFVVFVLITYLNSR